MNIDVCDNSERAVTLFMLVATTVLLIEFALPSTSFYLAGALVVGGLGLGLATTVQRRWMRAVLVVVVGFYAIDLSSHAGVRFNTLLVTVLHIFILA